MRPAVAACSAGRGLWGHCRHGAVPLRPTLGVSTGLVAVPRLTTRPAGREARAGLQPALRACVRAEFASRPRLLGYPPQGESDRL